MDNTEILQTIMSLLKPLSDDMQAIKADIKEIKADVQYLKGEVQYLKDEVQYLKGEVQYLKDEVQYLKDEVQSLKDEVQEMKQDIQELKNRVTAIEISLENETNHNIQLLAENHINLVDKLNDAIHVQDKSILYEVQVSGLKHRMDVLERQMMDLKEMIAS